MKKKSFLDSDVLEEKHVFGNVFIYIVSNEYFPWKEMFIRFGFSPYIS